jgi:hypothetical protein
MSLVGKPVSGRSNIYTYVTLQELLLEVGFQCNAPRKITVLCSGDPRHGGRKKRASDENHTHSHHFQVQRSQQGPDGKKS